MLATAHAKIYADFDAVDPGNVHQYLRELGDLVVVQQPCFIVCMCGTNHTILVLHGLAMHKRNQHAKSKYGGGTFTFLHIVGPGERASSIKLRTVWLDKETTTASTYNAFNKAIKIPPPDTTIIPTATQEKNTIRACLLPTTFAPLLLDNNVTPAAA